MEYIPVYGALKQVWLVFHLLELGAVGVTAPLHQVGDICSWHYQLYLMDFFFMPITRSENSPNPNCSVCLKSLDWMQYNSTYVKGRLMKKQHLGCSSEGNSLALRFMSGCWLKKQPWCYLNMCPFLLLILSSFCCQLIKAGNVLYLSCQSHLSNSVIARLISESYLMLFKTCKIRVSSPTVTE